VPAEADVCLNGDEIDALLSNFLDAPSPEEMTPIILSEN
jgi:hypothetical protein